MFNASYSLHGMFKEMTTQKNVKKKKKKSQVVRVNNESEIINMYTIP